MRRGGRRTSTRRAFALALLALAGGCTDAGPDTDWIARVDDRPIPPETLVSEVERRQEESPEADRDTLLHDVLEQLVEERAVLNRADALGVEVSDAEVQKRVLQIHGPDFDVDAGYRERVKRQMRIDRVTLLELGSELRVGEDEILTAFTRRREELGDPARVRVRQIVVGDEAQAREIHQKLRAGADFADLAEAHSIGPEATEGGLLPPFGSGEMPEAFEHALDLRIGELSNVIASPHGYHIFLLVEKFAPREPDLEEVREELIAELRREKLDELERSWLRDLRREAQIGVNEPLLETLR